MNIYIYTFNSIYCRELGNSHPIVFEFGNEKQIIKYWLNGKPLKVITHGWRGSDEDDQGVFTIKTGNSLFNNI